MHRIARLTGIVILSFVSLAWGQLPPTARPEDVGLSSQRLARATRAMEQDVAAGRIPGAVALLIRNGKVAYLEARGLADREARKPMKKDTIFRIYSMSKPITSVALMTLYEEGRFRITDPVARYMPEFANLKVLVEEPGAEGYRLVKPKRPVTIQDLMRHTAGLTYGFFAKSAVDQMYLDAGILTRDRDLAEMVQKLCLIPLKHQPGSTWEYSVAVDVQGRLIEVLSGMSFDQFLRKRIFEPLKMPDTGFYVPEAKKSRFAQLYTPDKNGGIKPHEEGHLLLRRRRARLHHLRLRPLLPDDAQRRRA